MAANILVYGAYGFTGDLIVRELLARDIRPKLAGRDATRLEQLAHATGLAVHEAALDDAHDVDAMLSNCDIVIHCAGPFARTSAQMVEACLRTGTSYIDITGEYEVISAVLARDDAARDAGIVMIPGAGWDVVPSDCLIATVACGMKAPLCVDLAILTRGTPSRGTAATMALAAGRPPVSYVDGLYRPVPAHLRTLKADFTSGTRTVRAISWGDLGSAPHSVHARSVTTYAAMGSSARVGLALSEHSARMPGARQLMQRVGGFVAGKRPQPDEGRERGTCELWVRIVDSHGRVRSGAMTTCDGYDFTAASAVQAAAMITVGLVPPGTHTPSNAFGASFALEIPGTSWHIEPFE